MDILIAEDEIRIAQSLKKSFEAEGHQVCLAADGQIALDELHKARFDVLLLDWRMPRLSGIEVCRRVRREGNHIPIILLTALSDISNKVEALNLGADDYITKPFSFNEVLARMQAVLRRSTIHSQELSFSSYRLDLMTRTLNSDSDSLKLPEMEFELLRYFIENKNSIINKEQLAHDVWKLNFLPTTNFIEATVKNLRKKLEQFCNTKYIKTIYGEGYTFIEEE